jgi:hypothetical protein
MGATLPPRAPTFVPRAAANRQATQSMKTTLLTALLLSVAVAGCGEKTLDADEVEGAIRPEYEKQTQLKLAKLSCDDSIKAKKGAKFSCEGTNSSDVELKIDGTIRSVKGSKAQYRWDVVDALAPGKIFAAEGQRQLEQKIGQKAKGMTCPDRVHVRQGEKVRCELTTQDDKQYGVTLTLTDDKGAFDVEVDEQPKT